MAQARFYQPNFLGGEWSKFSAGRIDDPKYRTAMATCENGFPMAAGPWIRRPPFLHVGITKGASHAALLTYSFEDNLPLTLELTDLFIRFYRGQDRVTDANSDVLVNSISTANPAVVETVVDISTWATGGTVVFTAGNDVTPATVPLLLNRTFTITMLSSTTFSIADGVTDLPIDGSTLGWATGLPLTVALVTELDSPYSESQVDDVRSVQDENDFLLLHSNTVPYLLEASEDGGFTLDPAEFIDGPYLDPQGYNITLTPDALTGIVNLTVSATTYDATRAYQVGDFVLSSAITYRSLQDRNVGHTPASSATYWEVASPGEAVNGGAGFTELDYGRHLRLFSEPPEWVPATTYAAKDVVKFDDQYWVALTSIAGAAEATGTVSLTRPGIDETKWALTPASARWTWGKITEPVAAPTGFIDPAGATSRIGNLTRNSKAYDGDTDVSETSTDTAGKTWDVGNEPNDAAYSGLYFAVAKQISSVIITPTNDGGLNLYGSKSGTLKLYASNTAPTHATNGTLLGTTSFNSTTQRSPLTILSTDSVTAYKYFWVSFKDIPWEYYGFLNAYWHKNVELAEIQFYDQTALAGSSIAIQIVGDPLLYTSAIKTWRLGLFNRRDAAYPTNGCYHEGRLWLAGSVKNRFDVSRSNEKFNFAPTDSDGSVPNNAAISYTFNADDQNQINWMIPDQQGIIAGTLGGEWLVDSPASNIAGFAPTNIRARRVTKYGSAAIEPKRTGLTTVFAQSYGRQLHEFMADAYSGKFIGPELTERNRSVLKNGVAQLAYQHGAVPIIWARTQEGELCGATYRRTTMISTQPPEILAWHRHDLGSEGTIVSIASGPTPDGTLDTLNVVRKDGSDAHSVELLGPIFDEDSDLFQVPPPLDSGVVPVAARIIGSGLRLYGLWPLNNTDVDVWIAGLDCGTVNVQNGYCDVLFNSASGLFTERYLRQVGAGDPDFGAVRVPCEYGEFIIPAMVGYSYRSRGQLLRPLLSDQAGTQIGPALGTTKRGAHYGMLLQQAQGLYVGSTFDLMRPAQFRTAGDRNFTPAELFSGVHWGNLEGGYSLDTQLCWEISRPFPAAIASVSGIVVGES